LTPDSLGTNSGSASAPATTAPPRSATAGEIWAQRLFMAAFLFLCTLLGFTLVVLPWTERWITDTILVGWPRVQAFFSLGFVRGVCSGLGLLDLWIGIWETLRYEEGA
jgi:hypothetical protein